MLSGLGIRNIVLIDRLDLDFRAGLSALTGETGAGKSILLDALGLALGGRGDAGLVRSGADQASVTANFHLPAGHPAWTILADQGIEAEPGGELTIRRTLSADGRSRAFANDEPVGVGLLKQLGGTLVDIHGQFETQGLLNPANHRQALDDFALTAPLQATVRSAWSDWRGAVRAQAEAREALAKAEAEGDWLRHAVQELDELAAEAGEEERLAEERTLLAQAQSLLEGLTEALDRLQGDRGAEAALAGAVRTLHRMAGRVGTRLDKAIEALDRTQAELAEALSELSGVADGLDKDPRRLERLEERLFALRSMARKHRTAADSLPGLLEELHGRLKLLEEGTASAAHLDLAVTQSREAYVAAATALSAARKAAAGALDAAVMAELPPMKLDRARFATAVEVLDEAGWSATGMDRVLFQVATNPGAPPAPLNKIASGGELARFMLALKVILAAASPIPTLVFDEADTGVGGAVADAIGERLARLADSQQVLTITHSPQVAARAQHHLQVAKRVEGDSARTGVRPLDADERREEIARMLSGAQVTDEARAAADRLLARPAA